MIHLWQGDITLCGTDAIVNAANNSLLGGRGVDGAIHKAAGKELLEECRALGGCATGKAKITKGYQLKSKYVIHTVGPVWNGGHDNEEQLLAECYRNSLSLAMENGCQSIAFPSISTGVYRFPKAIAADIALNEIESFLYKHFLDIWIVCFDSETYSLYKQFLEDSELPYGEER